MTYTRLNPVYQKRLRTTTVTGNSGGGGTFALNLKASDYTVVAVYDSSRRYVPYIYNGWWQATVCDYAMNIVQNTDVTVTVVYFDN